MTDNDLLILIRATLLPLMAQQGLEAFPVLAAFQPTTQGRVPDGVYIHAISDNRYGWQERTDQYDVLTGDQTHTEAQWHESMFQVQGFAQRDPDNLALPTAKDLTDTIAMLMQSQQFRQKLSKEGVGVQRITQVRAPYFVNDQGNFEQNPSFDVTFSHKRVITQTTPSITDLELQQTRV